MSIVTKLSEYDATTCTLRIYPRTLPNVELLAIELPADEALRLSRMAEALVEEGRALERARIRQLINAELWSA